MTGKLAQARIGGFLGGYPKRHAVFLELDVEAQVNSIVATSESTAEATVDTFSITAGEVANMDPKATAEGRTSVHVDGTVATQDLTLLANATRNASTAAALSPLAVSASPSMNCAWKLRGSSRVALLANLAPVLESSCTGESGCS